MQVKELGHAVLYVRDLERSRAFYEDLLGWPQVGRFGQMGIAFSAGRTHHELLLLHAPQGAEGPLRGRRVGLYHLGIKVGDSDDELREAWQALEAAGVQVLGATDHTVTHSLYIEDPDGNELELYVDVLPAEAWSEQPDLILAPPKPLRL